ncbi:DUF1127 domain-containing protein [Azospirillum sp.]|uniref:DUF1127 domain-containing protein n=1 Tax=Azospirillum sp. TaxID=34012 RepID=UPI003D708DD5
MSMALRSTHSVGHDSLATTFSHLLDTLAEWHQRAVSRRELAQLDDRMLHDIGVTSADVEREIGKPFWRS